jgi:hypothetical protein
LDYTGRDFNEIVPKGNDAMGIWMEVRCENRAEDNAHTSYDNSCFSNSNIGPMAEANDNAKSITRIFKYLESEAKTEGWLKKKGKWYCPHCKNLITA